ncbi:MAG: FecR domain-containing protein, partial [Cyclobacteriaceae bacterium]
VADDYFRQWVQYPDENNQKFWDDWIKQHPEKLETINEARNIVRHLNFKIAQPEQADIQEVREKIKESIEKPVVSLPISSSKKREWGILLKSAAALVAGITLLGLVYFYLDQEQLTTYTTQFGETQHIILPDSSTVILNANSSLSFSLDWQNKREVWLQGEAYFSVKKLEEKAIQGSNSLTLPVKFTVHTEDIEVVVLGTRFNVNERRGTTKVVLNSGRVQLKNTTSKEIMDMKPGDLVAFSKSDKKFIKKIVDPELFFVWKEGHFEFDGTPIKTVAKMLEEIYGYQVSIEDEILAGRKFTADIPSHDIEILLELIAESLDVKAEKNNNVIEFKSE